MNPIHKMNVQKTLRFYVNRYGPITARDAIDACFPGVTGVERRKCYSALCVDSREGRLDRIDRGLYDRRVPTIRST